MGYTVLGIDLCGDLLEFARERVRSEPFPPHPKTSLDVRFVCHDIETAALAEEAERRYDLALLDSVLHHFYNPVAALRHVGESLRPGARVAIIEALRPDQAPIDPHNVAIMNRYHTIERPYTRRQMTDILRLSGFPYHVYLQGVNGLYAPHELEQPLTPGPTGAVLAAREADALGRWGSSGLVYLGFYGEERDSQGPFRWATPSSSIVLDGRELAMTFTSPAVHLGRPTHDIFLSVDGEMAATLHLTESLREARFQTGPLPAGSRLSFVSDFSFCPRLLGLSADSRILAFQLRLSATA
jgi:SAM-dependent methyltransferase